MVQVQWPRLDNDFASSHTEQPLFGIRRFTKPPFSRQQIYVHMDNLTQLCLVLHGISTDFVLSVSRRVVQPKVDSPILDVVQIANIEIILIHLLSRKQRG